MEWLGYLPHLEGMWRRSRVLAVTVVLLVLACVALVAYVTGLGQELAKLSVGSGSAQQKGATAPPASSSGTAVPVAPVSPPVIVQQSSGSNSPNIGLNSGRVVIGPDAEQADADEEK